MTEKIERVRKIVKNGGYIELRNGRYYLRLKSKPMYNQLLSTALVEELPEPGRPIEIRGVL